MHWAYFDREGVLDCNAEDVSGELVYKSSFFSVLQDDITL